MSDTDTPSTVLTPLPVHGYTKQPESNVAVVNGNKTVEELVLRRFDEIGALPGIDVRWVSIGRTHLEQAFMALNRAVFRLQRIDIDVAKLASATTPAPTSKD